MLKEQTDAPRTAITPLEATLAPATLDTGSTLMDSHVMVDAIIIDMTELSQK